MHRKIRWFLAGLAATLTLTGWSAPLRADNARLLEAAREACVSFAICCIRPRKNHAPCVRQSE